MCYIPRLCWHADLTATFTLDDMAWLIGAGISAFSLAYVPV